MPPLRCFIAGTDTDVGKTWVTRLLVTALRAQGRRVWLWKPVACGNWHDNQAEDARTLAPLVADGQDPATLCRHQWPEAAAPHLAAAAAGDNVDHSTLVGEGRALIQAAGDADVLIEGAGGLLCPLSQQRATNADLAADLDLPLAIVTRPHLGTLNHTALTCAVASTRGLRTLGIIVNDHQAIADSLATRTVAEELGKLCATPVLGHISHGSDDGMGLAQALLAAHHPGPA
ncbi:MAG: dethiobiotin synthase [Planctomycetota bacterium]|jgi:dethiobiotin synthetase